MTGFLSKHSRTLRVLFSLSLVLLVLIGFYCKPSPARFLGFSRLVLIDEAGSACSRLKLPSPDSSSKIVWPTESKEPCIYQISEVSLNSPDPRVISLAIAGDGKLFVEIGDVLTKVESNGQNFKDYFFEIKNEFNTERGVQVKVKRISGATFIRERVEILSSSFSSPVKIVAKHLNRDSYLQLIIIVILSSVLLYTLIFKDVASFPLVLVSILGVFIYLSPNLYYYFDEWHILERFSKMGFPGVIHTHNEHSIIAFFVWYYALVNFLGDNYFALLVVSIVLHAVCAMSLEKLLIGYDLDRRAIRASVLFFTFSALHVEVLQWAFEQSIILSCISGIWGLIYLRKWIQLGSVSFSIISGLFLLLAPLLFGNGFIFFPLAFFVLFLEFRFSNIRKYILPSIMMGFSALIPVLIYHFLKKASAGHGVGDLKSEFDLYRFLGYIVVGSGVGTVGRGLGFYPNLTLSTVQTFCYEVFGTYVPWIDRHTLFQLSVEHSLGLYLWGLLIVVMSIVFWLNKKVRTFMPTSVLGLVLILLSFLLPAVGRTHLGELQALSLRYQYSAMLGFSMILCPLFFVFLKTKNSRIVFYLLSLIWMIEQAYLCQTFTYFTDHGSLHRAYVQELIDWEKRGMQGEGSAYEGTLKMNGLFPLARPSITPGSHPTDILKTAKWLNGNDSED